MTVVFALLHCLSFQKQGRGLSESTQSLSAAYQVRLSNDRRGKYSKRDAWPPLALLWARMDFELHPCAFLCAAPIWGCQACICVSSGQVGGEYGYSLWKNYSL